MDTDPFRRRAKRRLLAVLAVLAALAVAFWYLSRPAGHTQIVSLESAASNAVSAEVQKSVSNPAPLIATGTNPLALTAGQNVDALTNKGIITDTNKERSANGGLAALSENALLDQVASARLNDMAAKQYFAHVSPSSSSAETVARADGYDYIALGENLALGNFAGDSGVVSAWMASPGHRANILDTHYTDIGVAARQVIFDGEETWLAVQVFGRPASDCPTPDPDLASSIRATNTQLANMAQSLADQQAAIDGMSATDASYSAAVASYNALAATYNSLLGAAKANVNTYNTAVEAYNTCLGD